MRANFNAQQQLGVASNLHHGYVIHDLPGYVQDYAKNGAVLQLSGSFADGCNESGRSQTEATGSAEQVQVVRLGVEYAS
jgi:hypothetical protein